MSIWSITASVAAEPEVSLVRWRILETNDGTRHFVGLDSRDLTGRVSSAIVAFDSATMRGKTFSGRVYQLEGGSGKADDADYVWEQWCAKNAVHSFSDVTKQWLPGTAHDGRE